MGGIDRELASRIAASASRLGGLWSIDAGEGETYITRIEDRGARRLGVVRDLGPMRTVHLMRDDPVVLEGEKGPLDPRVLGPRLAALAARHPTLVTILDVAPRLLARLHGARHHWTGDWAGVETNLYIETGARVTQTAAGVIVRAAGRAVAIEDLEQIELTLDLLAPLV